MENCYWRKLQQPFKSQLWPQDHKREFDKEDIERLFWQKPDFDATINENKISKLVFENEISDKAFFNTRENYPCSRHNYQPFSILTIRNLWYSK